MPYNTKKLRHAYISKYNYKRDNQVVLLMITDNKKLHYLAVKSISGLLRGITSNHDGDFYCLNCFHSYTTEKQLKKHQRICRNHDFCHMVMSKENNKIFKIKSTRKIIKSSFFYLC